ncbi:MAG: 4-hydroxy-tetrahydrodipicolinate reductase [Phycisphaerae bacterium]|nr:4-hydroxy-tetrahydrodipicolinate reductase [Phycisphaerae bacterium]
MIRLAVAGAAGRMGLRIIALAGADDRFEVVTALEKTGHPAIGRDAGELAGLGRQGLPVQDRSETEFDVLIDFSLPAGTQHWLDYCLTCRRPMVIGTTGHSPEQNAVIEQATDSIAILKASNMSVGMNLLFKLVGQMAATLGEDYDIEIVEAHHRFKADAPSGTAVSLRDAILQATGREAEQDVIYGRHGQTGQRPPRQIGMHALRLGDTVGEHAVLFGSLGETLTISHSAHTRDTFAKGALRAAAWLAGKPAGRYDMQDVLAIRTS